MTHKFADPRKRVGVLLYNIHAAKTDLFVRLAKAVPEVRFKLFPLVCHPHNTSPLLEYKETRAKGRVFSLRIKEGCPAEVGTASLNLGLIRSVLRFSEVVVLFGCQGFPALATALLARILRKKTIVVYQGLPPDQEARRPCWIRMAKRALLRSAHIFVAQTPPSVANLKKAYLVDADSIVYAPYECGISEWKSQLANVTTRRNEVRTSLGIASGDTLVLFVGWLIELKGPHILVEAIARLRKQGIRVKAILIGEEPVGSTFGDRITSLITECGIANHIICLGRVDRYEIAKYFVAADLFALPSMRDLWPKAVVEAACAGLPIVTTDAVALAGYIVQDGVNGYVIRPGDTGRLADAILTLVVSDNRKAMGNASRKIVCEFTNPQAELDGFISALRRVGVQTKNCF